MIPDIGVIYTHRRAGPAGDEDERTELRTT